jgi:membrane-bound inhibitor of C-type lysozyme
MKWLSFAALLAATLGLSGCGSLNWWSGPAEQSRIPRDATIYKCDDAKQLPVRFEKDGKSAMIILTEREFRLDQVPAASGARYSNGRTTLNTKGNEASLEEGNKTLYANCKSAG